MAGEELVATAKREREKGRRENGREGKERVGRRRDIKRDTEGKREWSILEP